MGKHFFFTDPAAMGTQTPGQEFGPAAAANNKDRYHITDMHSGTNAPAIAVCDGIICVQPDGQGTYSIVLKPSEQPPFDFPYIKYFLYKGIDPASLVDANAVKDDTDIPFTQRLKDSWDDKGGTNPLTDSAKVLGLSYDALVMHTVDSNPTAIFDDGQPLDNFFYYPNVDFQLPIVRVGEKIGVFNNAAFGFEIVLQRLGYEPEIGLARTRDNFIEVAQIADPLNQNGGWASDDADYFLHWHAKEACLNYIDPCAYFGSFAAARLFHSDGTNKTKHNTPQEIYDNVLGTFVNRNAIYLDIRNDYNFSLNYFKDYGFDIKLADKSGANEAPLAVNQSEWPILKLDLASIAAAGDVKRGLFRTSLRLPLGQNSEPLVYLSRGFVKNKRKVKHKHKVAHPAKPQSGAPTDFVDPVRTSFATIDDGGDEFLSGYYKVNYYDQDRDGNMPNTLAPSKEFYLNGLFRPLDMQQAIALRGDDFHFTVWHEEALVNLSHEGGPAYVANVGIAEDTHHVTLFALPERYIWGSNDGGLSDAYKTWVNQSKHSTEMFIQKIFSDVNLNEPRKRTLLIKNTTGTLLNIDTIVVDSGSSIAPKSAFEGNEIPHRFVFTIFDKAEINSMTLNLVANSSALLELAGYFSAVSLAEQADENGVHYLYAPLEIRMYMNTNSKVVKMNSYVNRGVYASGGV